VAKLLHTRLNRRDERLQHRIQDADDVTERRRDGPDHLCPKLIDWRPRRDCLYRRTVHWPAIKKSAAHLEDARCPRKVVQDLCRFNDVAEAEGDSRRPREKRPSVEPMLPCRTRQQRVFCNDQLCVVRSKLAAQRTKILHLKSAIVGHNRQVRAP